MFHTSPFPENGSGKVSTVKVVSFKPELCTGCRECERACSNVHFKTDAGGEQSAIRIFERYGKFEMHVCDQRGLCIDLCPVGALKRARTGAVIMNKSKCIGCQACVGFCPIGAMRKWEGRIEPFKCISCGKCIEVCPENALYFEERELETIKEVVYYNLGAEEGA
jgi:carbon-monoxide dehydrogenase iron sulfur subunit